MNDDKSKPLSKKQALFVREYIKCGVGADAARAAGYSDKSAKHTAWILLNRNATVVAAIDEARKELQQETKHDLNAACKQALESYEMAKECKNPYSMVKAAELMAKLNGLLIERKQVEALVGRIDPTEMRRQALERVKTMGPNLMIWAEHTKRTYEDTLLSKLASHKATEDGSPIETTHAVDASNVLESVTQDENERAYETDVAQIIETEIDELLN